MTRYRLLIVLAVLVVLAAGVLSVVTAKGPKKPPGGCVCPMVYAPVECDQGTFSNQCVADCRNATNCEPVGPGPVPL